PRRFLKRSSKPCVPARVPIPPPSPNRFPKTTADSSSKSFSNPLLRAPGKKRKAVSARSRSANSSTKSRNSRRASPLSQIPPSAAKSSPAPNKSANCWANCSKWLFLLSSRTQSRFLRMLVRDLLVLVWRSWAARLCYVSLGGYHVSRLSHTKNLIDLGGV